MAVRTINLDDDAEKALSVVIADTGLTVPQAIRVALKLYAGELGLDFVKGEIRTIKARESAAANPSAVGEERPNFRDVYIEVMREFPDKPGLD